MIGRLWAGVIVAAAVLAVYWPVLTFDFVRWDDDISVTQNPLFTEAWTGESWKWVWGTDIALRFKPLHWLVFKAVRETAGFHPAAWHGIGLTLHLLTALALLTVSRQMLGWHYPNLAERRVVIAATVTTLLWALHPLRAEPVAWVTGSTYPLTAWCLVNSFAFYWKAHAPKEAVKKRRWLVASWVLAVAGYASYPVGLTYGLWLVLVDLWLLRGLAAPEQSFSPGSVQWRRWLGKVAAFNLPALLALAPTAWGRFTGPGIFTEAPGLMEISLWERTVMALASFGALFGRLVWPFGLTPNQAPLISSGGVTVFIFGLAAVTAVTLAAVVLQPRLRRCRPLQLAVWGSLLLALPCLGLTERPVWPVDRYSYLVHLVPVVVLGGWLGARIAGDNRLLAAATAAVLLLAGATATQLPIWRDSDTLFGSMEKHPAFADNIRQAGHVYVLWGRHAATQARAADAAHRFNQAQEAYLCGIKRALAKEDFQEAFDLSTHLEHHFTLTPVMRRERGAWLLKLRRTAEARAELEEALRELPGDPRLSELLQSISDH